MRNLVATVISRNSASAATMSSAPSPLTAIPTPAWSGPIWEGEPRQSSVLRRVVVLFMELGQAVVATLIESCVV